MLGATNIVAFIPTKDSDKARAFYEGVLGLRFVKDDGFALVLDANGITVRVAKVQDFKPAQFTILGWQVFDIENVVRRLQKKGVHFEIFGFLKQDNLGILDCSHGRQGGVVQGPRRECAVGVAACVRGQASASAAMVDRRTDNLVC
jgi:catechol 2,3-dioxygenase-like lactoylglutathione lyase family enzyme